jgi:hypothetical protein
MAFRFRYENLTEPPQDETRLHDVEVLAYELIEIARIRCEQLPVGIRPQSFELKGIHRDLGLAGFYASAQLSAQTREECLALAHDRCDAYPLRHFTAGVQAVFEGAVAAADALADVLFGLDRPGDAELTEGQHHLAEVHVAHLHALSASASLDRMVSQLRAR